MVECLTRDREVAGSSLVDGTALCPSARPNNSCLVLIQPRKTCPNITEKVLTGCKESRPNNPCLVLVQPRNTGPDITEKVLTGM